MKKINLLCLLGLFSLMAFAQVPVGYYEAAEGKQGDELRVALQTIIGNHTVVSYDALRYLYEYSDTENAAGSKMIDIYSTCGFAYTTSFCSGSCGGGYNREHSVPKSWFNEGTPMYSDAFHLYPTSCYVNSYRGNYALGETATGTKCTTSGMTQALGKRGDSSFEGFSGVVYEPDDEYKGDLARSYFYMATRYADICGGWGNAFNATAANAGLSKYSIALFLKWHRQDPVSQKEKDRNEAVYARQKNRNPFIDYPDLAEYIWGDNKGQAWYKNNTAIDQLDQSWISVFPNPATDFIAINAKDVTVLTYQLLDLSGKILQSGTAVSNDHIALNQFANGVYILQVNADNKSILQKIIINR